MMSMDKARRGQGALTPHMVTEHYLLSRGLRSFTCKMRKDTQQTIYSLCAHVRP